MSDITKEDVMEYCYSRNLMLVTKESLEYMHRPIVIETMNKNAIPIELYEQIKGERDVAIEQLKALNIELFEKPYLKAIPIEWIKKWLNETEDDRIVCFDIRDMLADWEKENEKDI